MTKFCGKVGFVKTVETKSGVYVPMEDERPYMGDVTKNYYRWDNGENLNDDYNINNTISIVADTYAYHNLPAIKYIVWMGSRWKVTSVEIQRPRLILSIGGVYTNEESC